ncbi:MAG: DUF934 domain-containing protein [Nitratireductor sp.]
MNTATPTISRIWKQGGFVADLYGRESAAVLVSPEEATGRLGGGSAVVLMLEAGDDPAACAGRIHEFAATHIRFPAFSDGRGFTAARILRERLHYKGPVRATGKFILDQIPLMLRTGFDEFEVSHEPTIRRLEANDLAEVPFWLQPAYGEEKPVNGRAWARTQL